MAALLICLLTLLFVSKKKESTPKAPWLFLLSLILLATAALFAACTLFAPFTAKESVLSLFGRLSAISFLPALFLRLLLRTLVDLPAVFLCLSFLEKEKKGKRALAFLPLFRYLLLGIKNLSHGILFSALSLLEPAEILFPLFFPGCERPAPLLLALLFWSVPFVLLLTKKRKRS